MLHSIKRVLAVAALGTTLVSISAHAQSLPGIKRDLDFDAVMKTVDLDDPALRLIYKKPTPDGSSVGMHIAKGEAPADASFVPTNSSSIPEAEVVAYRLSRVLGVSRNYYPVGYYNLGPKATAKFHDMVLNTRVEEEESALNRNMVLKALKANPNSILGIYRIKPKIKMYSANALGREGEFDRSTSLARALRAGNAMPGDEPMGLAGVKGGKPEYPAAPVERKVELARQLSTIFVIDQLLGQWDRFWENLEASGDKAGRLKLIARDNGGASLADWESFDIYSGWNARYDRDVIDRLTALNRFLKGEAKEFAGYTSVDAWKDAAGFIAQPSFDMFAKKLATLIDTRVAGLVDKYGDQTFFPPKSPEVQQLDAADSGDGE